MTKLRTVILALFLIPALAMAVQASSLTQIVPPWPGGPQTWAYPTAFFDEAAHGIFNLPPPDGPTLFDGWVSRYGLINGGTFFFTDLFDFASTNTATISWDFTGSSYWLTYVTTSGTGPAGEFLEHTYAVNHPSSFKIGNATVSLPTDFEIKSIDFYGTNIVPEPASLILLTSGALLILLWARFSSNKGLAHDR